MVESPRPSTKGAILRERFLPPMCCVYEANRRCDCRDRQMLGTHRLGLGQCSHRGRKGDESFHRALPGPHYLRWDARRRPESLQMSRQPMISLRASCDWIRLPAILTSRHRHLRPSIRLPPCYVWSEPPTVMTTNRLRCNSSRFEKTNGHAKAKELVSTRSWIFSERGEAIRGRICDVQLDVDAPPGVYDEQSSEARQIRSQCICGRASKPSNDV